MEVEKRWARYRIGRRKGQGAHRTPQIAASFHQTHLKSQNEGISEQLLQLLDPSPFRGENGNFEVVFGKRCRRRTQIYIVPCIFRPQTGSGSKDLEEKRYFHAKSTQNATFKRSLEKKQEISCFFRATPTNPWGPAQFWIHSRNARQPSGSVDNTVLRLSPAKRGRLSAKQYRCVETEKFRDTPNGVPRGMFGGVRRGA